VVRIASPTFVGRVAELAARDEALDLAEQGNTTTLLIGGDAAETPPQSGAAFLRSCSAPILWIDAPRSVRETRAVRAAGARALIDEDLWPMLGGSGLGLR
jgi:hypothetical protein